MRIPKHDFMLKRIWILEDLSTTKPLEGSLNESQINQGNNFLLAQEKLGDIFYSLIDIMNHYYVNKNAQSNWDHEVHIGTCSRLPDVSNRIYLWYFPSCKEAMKEAKKHYDAADGCYYCCNPCHTS